jgi:negative regulator of sigma E activity
MDERHAEALSAFFDGERIDADVLAESLADPRSGALLAEFAAMRRQAERDLCRPSPGFLEATAEKLRRLQRRRLWRDRFIKVGVAAALLLAVGITGFKLGSAPGSQRPRQPMRVMVTSAPNPTPSLAAPSPVSAPSGRSVPAAPKVMVRARPQVGAPPHALLRLRFGRWNDPSSPVEPQEVGGTR